MLLQRKSFVLFVLSQTWALSIKVSLSQQQMFVFVNHIINKQVFRRVFKDPREPTFKAKKFCAISSTQAVRSHFGSKTVVSTCRQSRPPFRSTCTARVFSTEKPSFGCAQRHKHEGYPGSPCAPHASETELIH